ncbi:hypothetical protein FDB65_08530 [Clostridium botulinum]|nr:hypothetical protein [Clostridium botulinum]
MNADFYSKLREKNEIENNINHLILNIFLNDKFKTKIIPLIICFIVSVGSTIVLKNYPNTLEKFLDLLGDSFSFSVGITSFLIAAFTIFFTMIKNETCYVFLLMYDKENRQSKLKTIIYNFIKPTIYFTFLIVYNFVFKLLYQLFDIIIINNHLYLIIKCVVLYIFFHLLYASIIELLFLIYNIYSFVMLVNLDNVVKKQLEASGKTYEKYITFMEKEAEKNFDKSDK